MAVGDIGSVVETLEFDTNTGLTPKIFHVSGNVYGIVYSGASAVVTIKTYTISKVGDIGDMIDSATLSVIGQDCNVLKITDTTKYIIAYEAIATGYPSYIAARIVTINITDAGIIGTEISTVELHSKGASGESGHYPKLIHVSGTIYAFTHYFTDNTGYLITFNVDDDGTGVVLEDIHDLNNGGVAQYPTIIKVLGTTYAVVYDGVGSTGYITTLTIADTGQIAASPEISTLQFSTTGAGRACIVKVGGTVYAIISYDSDSDGWIYTVNIDSEGVVTALASHEYNTDLGTDANAFIICKDRGDSILLIAYRGTTAYGWTKTYPISSVGAIGAAIDSMRFINHATSNVDAIHISGNYYAVVWSGLNDDGYVCTFDIETATIYPSNDISRVTGIRHIYRPGTYVMVLNMGDTSNTIEIAEHLVRKELAETPELKDKYPDIPGPLEENLPPPLKTIYPDMPGPLEETMRERGLSPWEKVTPWREEVGETFPAAVGKAYRTITPWKEEKGETFGSAVGKVVTTVKSFFEGLFD